MKHKNITFATCNVPGYNSPNEPVSKKGGGYPHKQPFNVNVSKKGGKK